MQPPLLRHKVLSCILACRKECSICSCSPSSPGTTWPLRCVMTTGFWNSSASFKEYCTGHRTEQIRSDQIRSYYISSSHTRLIRC